MKFVKMYFFKFFALAALSAAAINLNSACAFFVYQPKVPQNTQKLKKW